MAASNIHAAGKKIKPIQHPGLVLKTPIAYHEASDLSVLPIDKDGIAVCEKCGAIGVKHAFYTRLRKFCSVTCARGYTGYYNLQKKLEDSNGNTAEKEESVIYSEYKKQVNYQFKLMEGGESLEGMIPMEPLPRLSGVWQASFDDFMQPAPTKPSSNLLNTYEWSSDMLFGCDFLAAPVKLFAHAPLSDMWDSNMEGMKVEVRNRDCHNFSQKLYDDFWVATVLKLKGYMGLLRYEGFGSDDSKDFWINLMYSEVYPVGWCATRGNPLIPPRSIETKYSDWKSFLVSHLTGAKTLPTDFFTKVIESRNSRFRVGHILEVVDKMRISQVKLAKVHEIIGKRLHVRYYDNTPEDHGFWCHEDSPLIHPVGWARAVGHLLSAPHDYTERLDTEVSDPDDATPELFKYYVNNDPHNINFEPCFVEGMKLEAIDPLNLSSICVATVMRVLFHGHIMIRIDCYPPDESGADWFCYHERSPCIFPAGYCEARGIPLTQAAGQLPPVPASPTHIIPTVHQYGFVSGMRLECTDLMDPRLVCVATIARIVGRLLKVHFDGWGDEYDQWLDCESTDIYPVGWCRAVGYKLEGPFIPARQPPVPVRKRGRKKKAPKNPTETKNGSGNSRETLDVLNSNDEALFESTSVIDNAEISSDVCDTIKLSSNNMSSLENIIEEESQSNVLELESSLNFDIGDIDRPPFDVIEPSDGLENNAMEIDTEQLTELPEIPSKTTPKAIPRLVGNVLVDSSTLNSVEPELWDTNDVAEFLAINDCAPYCDNFCQITGKIMLELTKDEIIELLQMKVGPSLKIFDLIQQLKCKLKPGQARIKAAFK